MTGPSQSPAREVLLDAERRRSVTGHENTGFLSAEHGLLPYDDPRSHFDAGGAWSAWDEVPGQMARWHSDMSVRAKLSALPIADATRLSDAELLRAATLLGVYAHAFTRADKTAAPLPPSITEPWGVVCRRLGRPYPHLTYVDLIMHNFRRVDPKAPRDLANLRLLAPTVDSKEENTFYLTQVSILRGGTAALHAVLDAQDAIVRGDAAGFVAACTRAAGVLYGLGTQTLLQIDPNPYAATHVDPTVWAKTVAPLAVPLQEGLPGPSGTQAPLFQVLDLFMERTQHASELGRESEEIRAAYPQTWRRLMEAVQQVPASAFVQRCDRRDVEGAWAEVRNAYAGLEGFLGRHRLKVYGYLDVAFKVGRSVTIGGFAGQFEDRTWEGVDDKLDHSRREREPERSDVAALARIVSQDVTEERVNVRLDVTGWSMLVRPGDRCAVLPENGPETVHRMLTALRATGEEPVRLSGAWRAALGHRRLPPRETVSLREVIKWGHVRPVSRDVAKALAAASRSKTLNQIVEARAEESWDLAGLLECAAADGWSPSRPWRVEPGEAEYIARLVPPLAFRIYSVAGIEHVDPGDPLSGCRAIDLCVGRLRYQTTASDVTPAASVEGTASTYLADRRNRNRPIPVRCVRPVRFSLPEDPAIPVAMIAGGSGLAPFMSFLDARRGRTGAPDLLYLAYRTQADLDSYVDLREVAAASPLRAFVGLSREGRRLEEVMDGAPARDALVQLLEGRGHVYLCGRAGFVRTILARLEGHLGIDRVRALFAEGRMHLEVFSTWEDPAPLPEVRVSDLVTRNEPGDAAQWMAIRGLVVDVGSFAHWHPGGLQSIRGYLGVDATDVYRRVGHERAPEVDALLGLFTVGRMQRLKFRNRPGVVLLPGGMRTFDGPRWFRSWVKTTYALVEVENALRADFALQSSRLTPAETDDQRSMYMLYLGLDAQERFCRNLLDWFLTKPIAHLWAVTVGMADPGRDVRETNARLGQVRELPAVKALESLPERARQALRQSGPTPAWEAFIDTLSQRAMHALTRIKETLRLGLVEFETHQADIVDHGERLVELLNCVADGVAEYGEEIAQCEWPK